MTSESRRDAEVARPSKGGAVASPTALSNLIASSILLAGFFLPHSVDCDDQSHRPISIAKKVVTETSEPSEYLALAMFWPFAFAGLTLVVIVVLVFARPRWVEHALIGIPISMTAALAFIWFLFLFSGTSGSRMAMAIAVTAVPAGTCVALRMIWLCRSGRVAAAAAWGQGFLCVLAAFSLRWFWFPPITRLLWGGVLSIGSTMLMMFASWYWITRARHDLYDRSLKPLPFQISLRQMIIAITLTAIALTYWSALGSQ